MHLLTEDNYREYATLPDFIVEKYHSGVIGPALFTDLLRTRLLLDHGGTWIDATIYCTELEIPRFMIDSDLFLFQGTELEKNLWAAPFESYFMTAAPGNRILSLAYRLLLRHLEQVNVTVDTHIYYVFLQIAAEEYGGESGRVVPYPKAATLLLAEGMFGEWSEEAYRRLTSLSPFHKLSYKAKYAPGSILDHITRGDVPGALS